ncbi:amidohydrolase [Bacillus sp. DTU_2020_1000418_1_SI_GHA_SEK_038]|uniref:amidohydrolase n=1 Tax=Bacillus sp. DTU_2020_1000418_1_SI_GHA_SEK_038 TaxID=3077585 RepID=UPI0028EC9AD7|nr:amidohydrolase [Bacillus sp. DTU_2020_1000418_1_SI_GHA_SEK_038]WNS76921.1 amidohydrolase [Bacillus sp. DTU_2020_1000418_1_SI_GHA_SEK_038]
MKQDPIQLIDQNHKEILQTYQELHYLAEPSWKEEKTSSYIIEKLIDAGLKVKTYEDHFGLVTEIQGESEDVIALRADMDALVQEVDGEVRANHSCGHDGHSTMVLYTALALAESGQTFKHTIRFIFQPAEEKAEGALKMIEAGALKNVKFLGGIHVRPALEIPLQKAAPVILHGSTASIQGTIQGVPAHAARPEEGNNPIEAAAILIQAIRQIRLIDAYKYSIKITELHGGEASNLIPEKVQFTFDLRAETNETMDKLIKKAEHTISKIAELTETEINYSLGEYSPAAIRNVRAIELGKKAITSILGKENFIQECPSPGAEDFHFYTLKKPDISATMIGLGCDLKPGLHHPKMSFNKEALIYGAKILTNLLLEADKEKW